MLYLFAVNVEGGKGKEQQATEQGQQTKREGAIRKDKERTSNPKESRRPKEVSRLYPL